MNEKMPEKNPSDKEIPTPWEVTYDKNGNILGLPPGVKRKDVIEFEGPDGKHYAQLPTPNL